MPKYLAFSYNNILDFPQIFCCRIKVHFTFAKVSQAPAPALAGELSY
jgi:hypothetical protein